MLIDTDILIWYFRGNEEARLFLDAIASSEISAVTYMELLQGMRNKQELLSFRRELRWRSWRVIPINEGISSRAMTFIEAYTLSHSVTMADALVAATAIELGEPLATGNVKHYRMLPDLYLRPFQH